MGEHKTLLERQQTKVEGQDSNYCPFCGEWVDVLGRPYEVEIEPYPAGRYLYHVDCEQRDRQMAWDALDAQTARDEGGRDEQEEGLW